MTIIIKFWQSLRFSIKNETMSLSFFFSEINTLSVFLVLKDVFFVSIFYGSARFISWLRFRCKTELLSLQLINGVLYLQFILFTFSSIFKMIKLQIPFDSKKIYS